MVNTLPLLRIFLLASGIVGFSTLSCCAQKRDETTSDQKGEQRSSPAARKLASEWMAADTNIVGSLWKREIAGGGDKIHQEGVEEFLGTIRILATGPPDRLFFSEQELAFFKGRALVALSKIQMKNTLDFLAYREFLELRLFGRKGGLAGTASSTLGVLESGTVSYMAKRLYLMSEISEAVEGRYTFSSKGQRLRNVNPEPDHRENLKLISSVTNAVLLHRQFKSKFNDRTFETAIKLALASLSRDGIGIHFELAAEFRPLQVVLDALNATLAGNLSEMFWWVLSAELGSRDVQSGDCFFDADDAVEVPKRFAFLREDLELCKTMQASDEKPKKMTEKEVDDFMNWKPPSQIKVGR